jgi:hypothetical protein
MANNRNRAPDHVSKRDGSLRDLPKKYGKDNYIFNPDHGPYYDSQSYQSIGSVSLNTEYNFEEDEESSFLDGANHNGHNISSNGSAQLGMLAQSIELKKAYATEQMYWPFQRFHDIQGRRRLHPSHAFQPDLITPNTTTQDLIEVINHMDSSPDLEYQDHNVEQGLLNDHSNHDGLKKVRWDIPDFISPISDRKDSGLYMDCAGITLPYETIMPNGTKTYCDGKIFYMGIIDVLQQFNIRKRLEARWRRSKGTGWEDASCVHPLLYADRFLRFFDEYTGAVKHDFENARSNARPDQVENTAQMPLPSRYNNEYEYSDDDDVEEIIFDDP